MISTIEIAWQRPAQRPSSVSRIVTTPEAGDPAAAGITDGRRPRRQLTGRFRRPAAVSGPPPIRLHDLRHSATTPAPAAHTDLKMMQAMLRHTGIACPWWLTKPPRRRQGWR
ncbi:hypothetical protein ACIBQ1_23940 [Nonomuraea sp. NPDC050153]|uniref:hypothetical protein n=1 Tax=Nonomuraea sp. NPDC050153 TaxID=3364359 RepID=UPI0037BCFD67